MDQESHPIAELNDLSELYRTLLKSDAATEDTRIYNDIIQEVDFYESRFVIERVDPAYGLSDDEIQILEKAPHANVPLQKAADIIDNSLENKDWTERIKSARGTDQEDEYSWYNITQGYLNGNSWGYLASTTRYSVSAELPFIFRQPVARVNVPPDPKMPNLNRDLWTITENRPEVDDIASKFCNHLESISGGVIEVDLQGQKSLRDFKNGYALDHVSSSELLGCIDIGLNDVNVAEIRNQLCDLEPDPIYRSLKNESQNAGLNKQSISYDRGSDDEIRLTVSFDGVFDNVYDSISLSNKKHL